MVPPDDIQSASRKVTVHCFSVGVSFLVKCVSMDTPADRRGESIDFLCAWAMKMFLERCR